MGVMDSFKPKRSISELEEERETNEAEISVMRQRVLKRELERRSADVSSFKDSDGKTSWSRITNWLKTH